MGFAANLNKLCERAKDKAHVVVRKTAFELQGMMIDMSPVDTGRFRGNWQVGLGAINQSTSAALDPSGEATKGRAQAALQGWKPGQTIYLSNSLPYALRLERGWSQQAPSGVVRLTVQRYGDALAEAVKGLK